MARKIEKTGASENNADKSLLGTSAPQAAQSQVKFPSGKFGRNFRRANEEMMLVILEIMEVHGASES